MRTTILVGNPKPASRTLTIAKEVARRVAPSAEQTAIDLAEHAADLFAWPSPTMAAFGDQVAGSDLLIVASPTYKATYTGLLKAFLDRYNKDALRGVMAIPVMTGADTTHAMAPEVHLRPLLVELGATVPTRGLYFVMGDMDRMTDVVEEWSEENISGAVMAALSCATGARAVP